MKKVLILVLSADFEPYEKMIQTAKDTWDSIEEEGMETVYYCANFEKQNHDNVIYLRIGEDYYHMARKTVAAFEWALENKEFDYIARPHSCIYVNKKELRTYIDGLPDNDVFSCLEVEDEEKWAWGGIGWIISRDVVEKIVRAKHTLDNTLMEDMALSRLVSKVGVSYTKAKGCSINKLPSGKWLCLMYGEGESFEFDDFSEMIKSKGQYFYRVKYDENREVDKYLMEELFKIFK